VGSQIPAMSFEAAVGVGLIAQGYQALLVDLLQDARVPDHKASLTVADGEVSTDMSWSIPNQEGCSSPSPIGR
jgi:hypothetical protein